MVIDELVDFLVFDDQDAELILAAYPEIRQVDNPFEEGSKPILYVDYSDPDSVNFVFKRLERKRIEYFLEHNDVGRYEVRDPVTGEHIDLRGMDLDPKEN